MPAPGPDPGPVRGGDDGSLPRLRIASLDLGGSAPRPPGSADEVRFRRSMEAIHGALPAHRWPPFGPGVDFHAMAEAVAARMSPWTDGLDLIVTVSASPDCLIPSRPGCLLSWRLARCAHVVGLVDQGVAGPFTALRIAHDRVRSGRSHKALVVVLEQSTLPAVPMAVRPTHDVAVAMVIGPDGPVGLERPRTEVGTAPLLADPWRLSPSESAATTLLAGVGAPSHHPDVTGPVTLIRAAGGHPCAGVWLELDSLLNAPALPGGPVLVTDSDPVLPYRCRVLLHP